MSRPDRRCSLKVIHKEGGSKLESESSLQGQNQSINQSIKIKKKSLQGREWRKTVSEEGVGRAAGVPGGDGVTGTACALSSLASGAPGRSCGCAGVGCVSEDREGRWLWLQAWGRTLRAGRLGPEGLSSHPRETSFGGASPGPWSDIHSPGPTATQTRRGSETG